MKDSRSRRPKSIPHVALIIETSTAYGRAMIRGATKYIREAGPWTVYIEQRSLQDSAPPWLRNWDGDGIISRASTPAERPRHPPRPASRRSTSTTR